MTSKSIVLAAAAALWSVVMHPAQADANCGGIYVVGSGDTLSGIADVQYKNAGLWSRIHATNRDSIGKSPSGLRPGMALVLPCIDGRPIAQPDGTVTRAAVADAELAVPRERLRLLAGDNDAPYADRNALNGGLVTEIVESAMIAAAHPEGFEIQWVTDRTVPLDPLLPDASLDMRFPMQHPDCVGTPEQVLCVDFHFSDPLFERPVLLFAREDTPIVFDADEDMWGKTLCRPIGRETHDLDKNGRNWLKDNRITLVQPERVADCFRLLMESEVDAVVVDELSGRQAMAKLALQGQVDIVKTRPVAIEGLHVVVHKAHPYAQAVLALVNAGLQRIKDDGTYQQIMNAYMAHLWEEF